MKRALAVLGAVLFAGLLVGTSFLSARSRRMDKLFRTAAGYEPAGSAEARRAVDDLAGYRGAEATTLLLDIALTPNAIPEVQSAAIAELGKRPDPSISTRLASALQPHQPIATRRAVAKALLNGQCSPECVGMILHYRDRMWWGEQNFEDRLSPPSGYLKEEQRIMLNQLDSVLAREESSTLEVLVDEYGIGSGAPSPFALATIDRLELRDACPALAQSYKTAQRLEKMGYAVPTAEILKVIKKLNCNFSQ